MTGLGIIARCDNGGLASLTAEVHRHLQPERTLLLDLEDQGRGDCTTDDYVYGNVYRTSWRGGLSRDAIDWICAPGIQTLWSAEFWYGGDEPEVLLAAHRQGIDTACLAMPELAPWATTAPDRTRVRPRRLHVPTMWREDTLPDSALLPFPVARDRLPFSHRPEVRHLYHVTGGAMRDRNGTDLLLAALPFVTERCRLTIRTERPINLLLTGSVVEVDVVRDRCASYWQSVPADVDLFVAPRRYGGLSLPLQECASLGIPAITLTTDPYSALPFVHALSPTKSEDVKMKGGVVPVFTADPRALAAAIDTCIRTPDAQSAASYAADRWAEANAWHGPLGAQWCSALNAGCAGEVAA